MSYLIKQVLLATALAQRVLPVPGGPAQLELLAVSPGEDLATGCRGHQMIAACCTRIMNTCKRQKSFIF